MILDQASDLRAGFTKLMEAQKVSITGFMVFVKIIQFTAQN
jgi:hypothetical protein